MSKINIITGLDIGTSSLKLLVAKKTRESEFEVLALVKENSVGVRKGVIVDIEEVSNIVQTLVSQAEEISGQKISSVYVNIGGSHIFCVLSHGLVSVSRADQKISEEDINRVLQEAQTFSLPSNKEILNVFPKEFIVDGEKEIKEPLGMQGVRLEVEVLALAGFSPYLKNLNQAVLNSGLQKIDDRIPSIVAAANTCLTKRQKEIGVALLDIGAGTSNLAVFEEGDLIHLAIFPIGSGNITNDIAIGLKTDIDTAERIKIEFGACALKGNNKKEKVETEDGDILIFSQRFLLKIIEARVFEIFREVNKELKKISHQGLLPAGIVLTGGGSKIPGIVEFAKKELSLSCCKGMPQGIFLQEKDPNLSVVCGLVLEGADLESELKDSGLAGFGQGLGAKIKKIFKIFIP